MEKYDNYFQEHYWYSFSEEDLISYKKWFTAQWNEIRKKIPEKNNIIILEIWSGIWWAYQFIKSEIKNFNYTGLELDKSAVDFSNNYFQINSFQNVSFEEFESEKEAYDLILAFEVLEHIENPSKTAKKIHSLLKEDGIFIGTSPFPFRKNILWDKTHLSVLHPENWKRIFEYNGFSFCKTYPMSFIPFLWRIHTSLNFIIPIYISFKYFISTALIYAKK